MSEGEAAAARSLVGVPSMKQDLVVPSPADFEALVASRGTSEELCQLRQAVAAWQAVAEKCDHAFEEFLKLSTYRLQVERALGARLAQEVKPGRVSKRSPKATFVDERRLPDGVPKQQAAKYRQLAAVSDDAFAAYLQVSREKRKLPTSAGASFEAASVKDTRSASDDSCTGAPDDSQAGVTTRWLPNQLTEWSRLPDPDVVPLPGS